jgi:D-alanyl-D-alanine carboxypeptidase
MITIQQEATLIGGTSANLKYGDQLSIMDLLHGMMLPSGNDSAFALADHFGRFLVYLTNNKKFNNDQAQLKTQIFNDKKNYIKKFIEKMNMLKIELGM